MTQVRHPITKQFKTLYVKALDSLPVGIILEFPTTDSAKLPNGYMFCDGSAISRTEYSELFGLIGTTYGSGDGSTTFNLPTKEGLVSVGIDSDDTDFDTIGKTGGSKEDDLSNAYAKVATYVGQGATVGGAAKRVDTYTADKMSVSGMSASSLNYATPLGGTTSTLQPYTVSNYIIKVKHTRPLAGHIANEYDNSQDSAYSTEYMNWKLAGSNTDNGNIEIPERATELLIITKVPSITYDFSTHLLVAQLSDSYYIPSGWYLSSSNNGGIAWQYRSAYGIRCVALTNNGTDKRSDSTTYVYYR